MIIDCEDLNGHLEVFDLLEYNWKDLRSLRLSKAVSFEKNDINSKLSGFNSMKIEGSSMKYFLTRFGLMAILLTLASCSTLDHRAKTLSISGAIEVPLVAESGKYWIDNGPLFVANRNPLITYRVISKEELKFAGAEKPVYEFFESSFSDPEGIAEEAFRKSHESYELHRQIINGLTIYVFSKANESKAYIVSNAMHFGLEVYAEGPTSNAIVKEIITNARPAKGN